MSVLGSTLAFRLTINISCLAGVVLVRLRKAGRGVDGEVNFFSKLEEKYLRC